MINTANNNLLRLSKSKRESFMLPIAKSLEMSFKIMIKSSAKCYFLKIKNRIKHINGRLRPQINLMDILQSTTINSLQAQKKTNNYKICRNPKK